MAYPDDSPHSSPDIIQRDVQARRAEAEGGGTSPDVKLGKAEANYRPAGSSNTRCERCAHFSWSKGGGGSGTCALVAGTIRPDYVSDKFAPGGGGLIDLVTGGEHALRPDSRLRP